MFNFFEKLKKISIFEKLFSENRKIINNFSNCKFVIGNSLNSDAKSIDYDENKNLIHINNDLLGDDKSDFIATIREFGQQKGNRIIENKTYSYLEELQEYDESENNGLIEFFKNIVQKEDYKILRTFRKINSISL